MDGDVKTFVRLDGDGSDAVARAPRSTRHRRRPKPKLVRWFVIVGLLLALVLGGLYGFNRFRDQAIKDFFASNKPPPAQVAAVKATTETVPRSATGIGSLAAVQEVTVTPEVGGRVTDILFKPGDAVKAGDLLVQLNDAPDRADLANYEAQARWAAVSLERAQALATRQVGPQQNVDQWQSQLDQARAQIAEDAGDHRPETGQGAVRRTARGAPRRSRRDRHDELEDRHPDRSASSSTSISRCPRRCANRSSSGRRSRSRSMRFPAASSRPRSRRSSRRSAPIRA